MDPKMRRMPGVPFVVTDENKRAWEGVRGAPSRGMIVDAVGRFWPEPISGAGGISYAFAEARIVEANAGVERGIRFVRENAREIRNRPRLKCMVNGWPL